MESLAVCGGKSILYAHDNETVNFELTVKRANNLLMFRKFDDCLQWCCESIANLKNYAENERSKEVLDSLVIIAIQAFAELNRWLEVLPFVSQTYNGLEDCPSIVAKLCLLLHAKLKDHVTCTVLTNIWLKNPTNFSSPDYQLLAELYVERVLIPSQRLNDVRTFLDSCPGLVELEKVKYLRKVNDMQRKQLELPGDKIGVVEKVPEDQRSTAVASRVTRSNSEKAVSEKTGIWSSYLRRALDHIRECIRKYHLPFNIIQSLCFVAVFVYLLFAKWNTVLKASSSSATLAKLLSVLEMLRRGMFVPFYAVNR